LLAQPTTPQRANKKPYRHGTDAPRHYPHTLIPEDISSGLQKVNAEIQNTRQPLSLIIVGASWLSARYEKTVDNRHPTQNPPLPTMEMDENE
jgi:hypothetical protein